MDVKVTPADITNQFRRAPGEIKFYFRYLTELVDLIGRRKCSWDVAIAYLFSRVERAHVMSLYCGVVKLHGVDKDLAWSAISNMDITRKNFPDLYETVYGRALSKELAQKMKHAIKVRDEIIHGKERNVDEYEKLQAVMDILKYSELFNAQVSSLAGFTPFGNLTRFWEGRKILQTKEASRWILKGMGFAAR